MGKASLGLLFLLVAAAASQGPVRCYTGTQMSGAMSQGGLSLGPCLDGTCSTIKADITVSAGGDSLPVQMTVGQCVSAIACRLVTCEKVRSLLPSSLPMTFTNCTASCCSRDRCNAQDEGTDAGIVNPIVPPREKPVTLPISPVIPGLPGRCQLPVWPLRVEENWINVGRKVKTKPKFKLSSKKIDKLGGFKPNKKYKMILKLQKQKKPKIEMTGFFITLQALNTSCVCKRKKDQCGVGTLIGSRLRRAGEPVIQPGCDQPLIMDMPPGGSTKKPVKFTWQAPRCSGPILMRAAVRGSDGKLYVDNDDDAPPKKMLLTKLLTPLKR